MRTKNYAIGIAVALTLPVLSSCGSTQTKTVKISPPTEYLSPTPEPTLPEEPTNRQVDDYCRTAVERLRSCNDDKQALKEWSNGQ